MTRRVIAIMLLLLGTGMFLCAQDMVATKPHAPMELMGMGPEMFQDRSVAWVKAIGEFLEQVISKFGVIALAAITVWQTITSRTERKEIKDRLDRQGERIDQVAIAAIPPANNT